MVRSLFLVLGVMAREGPDEARDAMIEFIRDPEATMATEEPGPRQPEEPEEE